VREQILQITPKPVQLIRDSRGETLRDEKAFNEWMAKLRPLYKEEPQILNRLRGVRSLEDVEPVFPRLDLDDDKAMGLLFPGGATKFELFDTEYREAIGLWPLYRRPVFEGVTLVGWLETRGEQFSFRDRGGKVVWEGIRPPELLRLQPVLIAAPKTKDPFTDSVMIAFRASPSSTIEVYQGVSPAIRLTPHTAGTGQSPPLYRVYINEYSGGEEKGRQIICKVPKESPLKKDRQVAVSWKIRHTSEVFDARLSSGRQADIPHDKPKDVVKNGYDTKYEKTSFRSGDNPFEYSFRMSACNKDRYTVTLRVGDTKGKSPAKEETVVIEARRRVYYYYVEMQQPTGQGSFQMPKTVTAATGHFATEFGIDMLPKPKEKPVFHLPYAGGTVGMDFDQVEKWLKGAKGGSPGMPKNQVKNWLAGAKELNWANRGKRELCIVAVDGLRDGQDTVAGGGGRRIAVVSVRTIAASRQAFEAQLRAYDAWKSANPNRFLEDYVNNFPQDQRPFWMELLRGKGAGVQAAYQRQVLQTLVHEIGHVFGLVSPSANARKAAGIPDTGWHDANHQGHCATRGCVMWWMNDRAQGRSFLPSQKTHLFQHYDPDDRDPQQCALYLLTCDLSELGK
jgi:hypothetical protein